MKLIRKLMWPGVLIALIAASVIVHVTMLIVINMNPGMTTDMRQIEKANVESKPAPAPGESSQP